MSLLLIVVIISVCFMKPVKISNLSSSDILGLVAGLEVVTGTEVPGVVNLLKAGRLLLFLVVCGSGSVVRVGVKGNGRREEGPCLALLVVCGGGSVMRVGEKEKGRTEEGPWGASP